MVDKMLLFGTPKDDYIPVMVRSVQRESGRKFIGTHCGTKYHVLTSGFCVQ